MLTERTVDIGTVEINFSEGPKSGPPLVFLHGLPGRWQEFLPILPQLMLNHHVHAIDLRGQGESGRVPGHYLAKYYVDDTIQFLQKAFKEPVTLFGHSAGGIAALVAAARAPDLVKAVIVGDSPLDKEALISWMTSEGFTHYFSSLQEIAKNKSSIREISKQIEHIPVQVPGSGERIKYGEFPGIDSIRIQQLAVVISKMEPEVLTYHAAGQAEEFLEGYDLADTLENLQCPILLMQANPELGGMMTNEAVKFTKLKYANTEHIFFETNGHDLGLDSWDVAPLLRVTMNFLSLIST